MDRLDSFKSLIDMANSVPEKYDISYIKKKTKRKYRIRQCLVGARNVAAVLLIMLITIGVGVNSSRAFANGIKKIPFLGNVARMLDFSERDKLKKGTEYAPDMRDTFDYLTEINQTVESKVFGFDGTVQYAFADEFGLCIYFKINKPTDKLIYIDNASIIDTKDNSEVKLIGIDSYDMLKTDEYNLFRFYWNEFHENITLNFTLCGYSDYNTEADSKESFTFNISGLTKLEGEKISTNSKFEKEEFTIRVDEVNIYPSGTIAHIIVDSDARVLDKFVEVSIFDRHGLYAENNYLGLLTFAGDGFNDYNHVFQSVYFKFNGNIYLSIKQYEVALEKNRLKYSLSTNEATLDGNPVDILTICNKSKYDIARGVDKEIVNNIYVENEEALGLPALNTDCYYIAFPKSLGFDPKYQSINEAPYKIDPSGLVDNWEYNGEAYYVIEVASYMVDDEDCLSYSSCNYYTGNIDNDVELIKTNYEAKYKEIAE